MYKAFLRLVIFYSLCIPQITNAGVESLYSIQRFKTGKTVYSYRLDPACNTFFGDNVATRINNTIKESFSSFNNLKGTDKNSIKIVNGHIERLYALLTKKITSISCSLTPKAGWESDLALGSTDRTGRLSREFIITQTQKPAAIQTPYIVLNMEQRDRVDGHFKTTIIHELLHNAGYKHGEEEVEYPYTCSECFFPTTKEQEKRELIKKIACRMCSKYSDKDITSDAYRADLRNLLIKGIIIRD